MGALIKPVAGETIYGKLKRLGKAARFSNPHVLPVMSSPPAVTLNTVLAGQTNLVKYWVNSAPYFVSGGNLVQYATDYVRVWCVERYSTGNGNVANNPPLDGVVFRAECMADSAKPCIAALGLNAAPYRVIVDGQYIDKTTGHATSDGGLKYINLDFTSAGGRKVRHIVLEGQAATGFVGVAVGPTESVFAPSSADRLRMIVGGDSFTGSAGAKFFGDGWAVVLGDCLGIKDIWSSGSGTTGYLASATNTKYTLRQRITDIISRSPDIIVLANGVNDVPFGTSAVQTEFDLVMAAIRAALPKTPVFVVTSFMGNLTSGANLTNLLALEAGLKTSTQARQAYDANLFFIDVSNAADGAWIFGTGRTGATVGDGNADFYTGGDTDGSDAVHPTTAGHAQLGYRAADAILAAIANKA